MRFFFFLLALKIIYTGQKWAKKTTKSSEQVDYTRGIAEPFAADQVSQIHGSERIHASFNVIIKIVD
jgi:hypothetical protein